jgi:hypothetical protein
VTERELRPGNGVKRHGDLEEKTAMSRNRSLYRARGRMPGCRKI